MNYYTRYKLEVIEGDISLIQKLRDFSEYAKYAIDNIGETYEPCKWYKYSEEMKKFSLLHPEALFKLTGKGGDVTDIWQCYYKNGKSQYCKANVKITFDSFDENLLK